jgi:alpha-tubulin suppressor-like RCC1 family protein
VHRRLLLVVLLAACADHAAPGKAGVVDAAIDATDAADAAGTSEPAPADAADANDATALMDATEVAAQPCGVRALSGGDGHTCALMRSGGVRCWGFNGEGQLGDGTTEDTPLPPPVDLLEDVQALSAGAYHTCVVRAEKGQGGVRCWGENGSGQLGDGTTDARETPPGRDVLTGVTAVAAGPLHTCALTGAAQGRGVRCWGANDKGQLGDGSMTDRLVPPTTDALADVQAIATRYSHSCAVTRAGGVRCWGANEKGQLGDGTTTGRPAPVAAVMTGAVAVTVGLGHTCAVTVAGGVRCWGDNVNGQLGDGTTTGRLVPAGVDVLTDVQAITAGISHTCALSRAGVVRCWGSNVYGELGDGTKVDRNKPTEVLTNVEAVAAAASHTCALTRAGEALCWGRNEYGQVGDGTTIDRTRPTKVALCK